MTKHAKCAYETHEKEPVPQYIKFKQSYEIYKAIWSTMATIRYVVSCKTRFLFPVK